MKIRRSYLKAEGDKVVLHDAEITDSTVSVAGTLTLVGCRLENVDIIGRYGQPAMVIAEGGTFTGVRCKDVKMEVRKGRVVGPLPGVDVVASEMFLTSARSE